MLVKKEQVLRYHFVTLTDLLRHREEMVGQNSPVAVALADSAIRDWAASRRLVECAGPNTVKLSDA